MSGSDCFPVRSNGRPHAGSPPSPIGQGDCAVTITNQRQAPRGIFVRPRPLNQTAASPWPSLDQAPTGPRLPASPAIRRLVFPCPVSAGPRPPARAKFCAVAALDVSTSGPNQATRELSSSPHHPGGAGPLRGGGAGGPGQRDGPSYSPRSCRHDPGRCLVPRRPSECGRTTQGPPAPSGRHRVIPSANDGSGQASVSTYNASVSLDHSRQSRRIS